MQVNVPASWETVRILSRFLLKSSLMATLWKWNL